MTTTRDAGPTADALGQVQDPTTQSNWAQVITEHSHFDWTVDFEQKIIHGSVTHSFLVKQAVQVVSLDCSHVALGDVLFNDQLQPLKTVLHDRHPVMGNQLDIHLDQELSPGHEFKLRINYATTADCTALGWLSKEQTSDGTHPFVYSQCQAIHARSLFPCQDTPAVKFTYSATARSAQEGCTILLSARRDPSTPPSATEAKYDQPIPIPSYLVAVNGGKLDFADLGERCGVWAEPSVLKAAKWEFEDTAQFVEAGEKLAGKYEWGRYDVLVMPKSFPYGGMENTNLTSVTPTLLAGDRSLVHVVAHEFSHSYFGNLISCANWCSFWLNEGFTTYLERLIMRELYGEPSRAFSFIKGRNALQTSLKEFEKQPRFQRLHIDYEPGEDPDEAFSTVPYDKGSNFLLHIERTIGGLDAFLPYLQNYVKTFRNCSITTDIWKSHLFEYFKLNGGDEMLAKLKTIDFDAWLYGEGMSLPVDMKYDTSLADAAYALAARWDAARNADKLDFSSDDLKNLNANQIVVFLEKLERADALPASLVYEMNKLYKFDSTGSAEVRLRWYTVALKPGSGGKFAQSAADWVTDKGRMKFCRPTYRLIFGLDKELARATFREHEAFYHPIARNMIAKDIQLE